METNIMRKTKSICPQCNAVLEAEIFERDGKVFIKKECSEHGIVEDLYFGSAEMYRKFDKFSHDGKAVENPNVGCTECPKCCGLCKGHLSGTALANIMLTNRCDLACWYCFAYAKKGNYVYEPSLEQIRKMLKLLRAEKPVPANAIQFTGGEPTLRKDLIEILKMAKEEGFDHVQLNTNGINISKDPELMQKIKDAGVNTIYLSFDGVTENTNPKNHWEIPFILKHCREAGIGIVLVPTVIKGVNDHEIGDIIRFGFDNIDVVRGINFQPVSLVGRMPREEREKHRITIPDVIDDISKQTRGEIEPSDFYPVPTVVPITHFVEAIKGEPQYEFTCLPFCGAATYVFRESDNNESKLIPITRFVKVDELMQAIQNSAEEIENSMIKPAAKLIEIAKLARKIGGFIDHEKEPKNLNLAETLVNIVKSRGDYSSLDKFHHNALFIGSMHFQDKYNYDIDRVRRCVIHYATPDDRIIPFCAFNVIPELYRDAIQRKYSVSIEDWESENGKLDSDLYRRDAKALKETEEYKKTYAKWKTMEKLPGDE